MFSYAVWFVVFPLLGNCYQVQKKIVAVWLVFSCATVAWSMKGTVANPK